MLEKMINSLDRDSLVALMSDDTVSIDTLRICVCMALGGNTDTLMALATPAVVVPPVMPGAAAGKRAAVVAGVAAPAAVAPPKPAAAKPAAPNGAFMSLAEIDAGIAAWRDSGQGFAFADLKSSMPTATESMLRGRIKVAVAEGRLVSFGEKRFSRYAKTAKAAQQRSESDRRSAGAPG